MREWDSKITKKSPICPVIFNIKLNSKEKVNEFEKRSNKELFEKDELKAGWSGSFLKEDHAHLHLALPNIFV